MPSAELPEFREWSMAAVRLVQGVIYADEPRIWDIVLASQPQLAAYFARLGLILVVDEPEGLAYLRQMTEDEQPEGYDHLPKLFHKKRLGYDDTVVCVLLREELRRFEDEDLHNDRCVVEAAILFERWRSLSPAQHDDVRARRELSSTFTKLEELGFIRRFSDDPEAWEIRRILKARLPVSDLEDLKNQLVAAAERRVEDKTTSDADG